MDTTDGVIGIAGGRELIDFERLLDRMSERYPGIPRAEIQTAAMIEHDAITGGELYAVPRRTRAGPHRGARLPRSGSDAASPPPLPEPPLGLDADDARAGRDPCRSRHPPGTHRLER